MFNITELASKLGVCEKRVHNIARDRGWECEKIGRVKLYDIDDDDIEQFKREKEAVNSETRLQRERIMSMQLIDLTVLMDKAIGKKLFYTDKAITMTPSYVSLGWNSNDINKKNQNMKGCGKTGPRICSVEDYKKVTEEVEKLLIDNIKLKSVDIYNSLLDDGLLTFESGEITRKSVNVRVNTIREKVLNLYRRQINQPNVANQNI